ncbi:MAG: diguanylate cyclase [Gammaproteobacteria bacterium]|nr:diguanylate cyclase [Gammaproteobacteria bacterium]
MRALITENSRLYRQLLDNILGQQGFENDICSSIEEATTFLNSEQYQVICVNQHLEDGHGSQLIQYCNDHNTNNQASILYLTIDEQSAKVDTSLGIDRVIIKKNLQQITDQIIRFTEEIADPKRSESRILFVEDSKSITALITSHLSQAGYNISHFCSGERAWEDFNNEISYGSDVDAYDLVITDINLEGEMTGNDLVSQIRDIDDARGFVPVIAITGENSDELRLSLYQIGVNDYLQKPVLIEELLIRVNHLITNKRLLDKVHDQRRELYALATTDKLTGCHNRHSLMEFSEKFISQAFRHNYPLSLMVIDLDHFKSVNDTYGHAVGDIVLSEVGNLLNLSFREGDLVARFGGEEFVVLLSHCDRKGANLKAEKLRSQVEALKPHDLTVTSSIGVTAMAVGEMADFATLFSRADLCVYEAKDKGRNRVVSKPLKDEG